MLLPPNQVARADMVAGGDAWDVYMPNSLALAPPWPVAVFLQGFEIDKGYYSRFCETLCSFGFAVCVPNHRPTGRPFLAPEPSQVASIPKDLKDACTAAGSPVSGKIDVERAVLLGHSAGGRAGLDALFHGTWLGGVFLGSTWSVPNRGAAEPPTSSLSVAMIAGELDTIVVPQRTKHAFAALATRPKAYVSIAGANHYGMTNVPQPPNGPIDTNGMQGDHDGRIVRLATLSGAFLRAFCLRDQSFVEVFEQSLSAEVAEVVFER